MLAPRLPTIGCRLLVLWMSCRDGHRLVAQRETHQAQTLRLRQFRVSRVVPLRSSLARLLIDKYNRSGNKVAHRHGWLDVSTDQQRRDFSFFEQCLADLFAVQERLECRTVEDFLRAIGLDRCRTVEL